MDAPSVPLTALPTATAVCPDCGAAISAPEARCAACAGPVELARPLEDAVAVDATIGDVTLHAGHLATIVALDRGRENPVEIVTCPLSRAELDHLSPFDAAGGLKPGRSAEEWPPLVRLWVPERVLSSWPSSVYRQRWSVAADSRYDPSLIELEAGGWHGFWRRRDAVVTVVTVAFIVVMTLLIIGTTVLHIGPSSPLTPMSPNG